MGLLPFGLLNIGKKIALTMDFSKSSKDMYLLYAMLGTILGEDEYLLTW